MSIDKKFELFERDKSTGLWRIRALRDIPQIGVQTGDLGGLVEKENNLAQTGDAWVGGKAQVTGDAWVSGNAWVGGNAKVRGNAKVFDGAWVGGNAKVSGNARVFGEARVFGDAWVDGSAQVSGNAWVSGNAKVSGNAWVSGSAKMFDGAWVDGNAKVELPEHCITISGLEYLITITPQAITIGCQCRTREEWLNVTQAEAVRLGLSAAHYPYVRTLIELLYQIPRPTHA